MSPLCSECCLRPQFNTLCIVSHWVCFVAGCFAGTLHVGDEIRDKWCQCDAPDSGDPAENAGETSRSPNVKHNICIAQYFLIHFKSTRSLSQEITKNPFRAEIWGWYAKVCRDKMHLGGLSLHHAMLTAVESSSIWLLEKKYYPGLWYLCRVMYSGWGWLIRGCVYWQAWYRSIGGVISGGHWMLPMPRIASTWLHAVQCFEDLFEVLRLNAKPFFFCFEHFFHFHISTQICNLSFKNRSRHEFEKSWWLLVQRCTCILIPVWCGLYGTPSSQVLRFLSAEMTKTRCRHVYTSKCVCALL